MARTPLSSTLVSIAFAAMLASVWWLDHRAHSVAPPTSQPAPGFRLLERAAERGIRFTHRETTLDPKLANIAPHVSAMGAAVSVVDFDNDGWSDLYATSSRFGSANALFKNERGQFRDVAPQAGLAELNRAGEGVSMGSIWADFDNDGFEDVFVYKWGWQQLLRNRRDGTFEDVSAVSGVRRWMNSNGACWLDYDRDGFVDLYVAGYFSERVDMWNLASTRIMQESFEFASNGGHNVLLRNRGDGTFEDVTAATGCDSPRWTLAVAAADMDGDGFVDLYLANDYGPEELFRNVGGERFELLRGVGLEESSKSGMSVTLGDFDNSGRFGVYVTNISKERFLFQGNNLRRNRLAESGKLFNIADTSSTSSRAIVDCGWAWGAQFGDLDNDGRLDLFVANGFVSASRERDYWYGMSKVAGGAGNLFEDATLWEPMGDASLSGYEVSRVLLNQGGGHFRDVAGQVGVDDEFDGRAVAFADLGNRGVLDVIVANQKGPLLVYENQLAAPRHWVQLKLVGRRGNPSAIGAEVTLEFAGARQVQSVQAGSGFCAQNERRLHFGLGDAERVDRVTIRWPNGALQVLGGLELDRMHTLEEPQP
ncbi:MAG: CRTAC1 family protein [Planctomycetes bacterium]|nr:CRTAC1 family protein [Planctomycetota bacterium]